MFNFFNDTQMIEKIEISVILKGSLIGIFLWNREEAMAKFSEVKGGDLSDPLREELSRTELRMWEPTEAEVIRWRKYVFLDKSNVIRLTDAGCFEFNNGTFTSINDDRLEKILYALIRQQYDAALPSGTVPIPMLRYDPITISPRLAMPFQVQIYSEIGRYGWVNNKLDPHEILAFKLEQAAHWHDYVYFDEKTHKVHLTILGDAVLLGNIKIPEEELTIFKEMIAVLLTTKLSYPWLKGVTRMESLELPLADSSVRQLSVELVHPQFPTAAATIRIAPLFRLPVPKGSIIALKE
ncbi:MAG: hypothetical protein Hyperionvirus16_27 [Hyperionvirus sp.]|uniref:Uncharacterized protein n=1 Tax=Hyperionvirus sp. TaxID=2487770 RepID=A0A3G5AAD5_9VIRU|nr:MAG: hypothetical protein Hyperionvirus16_27 [Hyperionvirus sp.]